MCALEVCAESMNGNVVVKRTRCFNQVCADKATEWVNTRKHQAQ